MMARSKAEENVFLMPDTKNQWKVLLIKLNLFGKTLDQGTNRIELNKIMKAGAARNAIDCAMWD